VGDAEQRSDLAHGEVGAPVDGDEQHPVGQVEGPLSARSSVGNRRAAAPRDQPYQLAELRWLQPGEGVDPFRPDRADHLHRNIVDDRCPKIVLRHVGYRWRARGRTPPTANPAAPATQAGTAETIMTKMSPATLWTGEATHKPA
jgi:hypothetical protein